MTVQTDDHLVRHEGDGSTVAVAIPFKFLGKEDLVVAHWAADGTRTLWALGTDYAIAGTVSADWELGGTLTASEAWASGSYITIQRQTDDRQQSDYTEEDGFPEETVEADFDRAMMLAQEARGELGRALLAPAVEQDLDMTLPAVALRAGLVAGYTAAGLPTVGLSSLSQLDSLVSGSLAAAAALTAVPFLGTVADLRNNPVSPGLFVDTLGYYSAGDGGGDGWWADASDTTSADDGCYVIVNVATGVRFKRLRPWWLTAPQIGMVDDGVFLDTDQDDIDDTASGTNNQPFLQAWADGAQPGYRFELTPGDYYVQETATTLKAWMTANAGATYDAVDYMIVSFFYKRDLEIVGSGGRLLHNRGYAFCGAFCEGFTFDGVKTAMPASRYETAHAWIGGSEEPASIEFLYSVRMTVRRHDVVGAYRGIMFARSNGVTVEDCDTYGTRYIGISFYATLTNPGGLEAPSGTAFDPAAFYSRAYRLGARDGYVARGNKVRRYGWMGIYTSGAAIIAENRIDDFMDPDFSGATVINGVRSGAGYAQILGNRFTNPGSDFLRGVGNPTNPETAYGILLALENGTGTVQGNVVKGNYFEGWVYDIFMTDIGGAEIEGNTHNLYTLGAITMAVRDPSSQSIIRDLTIQGEHIGPVDPATVRARSSGNELGGIVISVVGAADVLYDVAIKNCRFRQALSAIVDATTRASHQARGMWLEARNNSTISLAGNEFDGDSGLIGGTYNNISGFTGRKFAGVPIDFTAGMTIPSGQADEVRYRFTGSADAVVKLSEKAHMSKVFVIENSSQHALTIEPYAAGYTVAGLARIVLDNRADPKARSSVRLVVRSGSSSSDAYDVTIEGSAAVSGANLGLNAVGGSLTVTVDQDDMDVPVGGTSYIKLISDDATPGNRTINIGPGAYVGHEVTLHLIGSTGRVQLVNGSALVGGVGAVRLANLGGNWEPAEDEMLTLKYDGVDQVAKSG